jgi:bacterioferritin-associated ferredoxin
VNRVYVCSCFGITEEQVRQHVRQNTADGRCTPRQIASACKAGTDCGSCVKRIQALLGRGAGCVSRRQPEPVTPPEPVAFPGPAALAGEPAVQPPARAA